MCNVLLRILSTECHSLLDGGIGDDVFSLSFDGKHLWMGGNSISTNDLMPVPPLSSLKSLHRQSNLVSSPCPSPDPSNCPIDIGDVIGCCIDFEREIAWFTKNGEAVNGQLRLHDFSDTITPAVSFSAGVR